MSKKIIFVLVLIIVIAGIGYWIYQSGPETKKPAESAKVALDLKNCAYIIEGKKITLKDGYSEEEIAPGSASKLITQYLGNEAPGDFNKDGLGDIAFILAQDPGGSGAFYYIAVALGDVKGYQGTNAVLLGDRIALQNTEIQEGKIIVNYADRKIDEAMTVSPSIGISRQFALEGKTLKDVTPEEAKREQGCLLSGGTVETSLCCASASDFPNVCLIGACGCSPADSHQVKVCNCGEGKCFDGSGCVVVQ